jgi:DNA-binding transcriptional LysR family regulator
LVPFRSPSGGHVWRDTLSLNSGGSHEQNVKIKGRLELDEILFLRNAVTAGIGVAIVPLFLSHFAGLVRVLPGYVISATPVYVVSLGRQFAPERVVLLREFLIQQLSAVKWRDQSMTRRKEDFLPKQTDRRVAWE